MDVKKHKNRLYGKLDKYTLFMEETEHEYRVRTMRIDDETYDRWIAIVNADEEMSHKKLMKELLDLHDRFSDDDCAIL